MDNLYKFNNLLFVISSIIFSLAVSGVYIFSKIDAAKIDSSVPLKIFGGIVVLLTNLSQKSLHFSA